MSKSKEYGDIFGGRCLLPGVFCKRAEKELELLRHALYMSDLEFELLEEQHEYELEIAYENGREDESVGTLNDYTEAHSEGYDRGYTEGYAEGFAEGMQVMVSDSDKSDDE